MNQDPKIAADPLLHQVLADVGETQAEADRRRGEVALAKERLFDILEQGAVPRRLIAYINGPSDGGITLHDAAPIGSMLDAVGTCDNLDLMLNSPGGSGETAEKLIEMCRDHCLGEFRVIVPNYAKSAATMIALGADSIVMGYPSELGPIDPQYPVKVGGMLQYISGQSFISAFDNAQEEVRTLLAAGESPAGYMQSLATTTMEPAFVDHCRRGMEFAKDVAVKFLPKYQLPAKYDADGKKRPTAAKLRKEAEQVGENLLSRNSRFVHGRLIGASEAIDEIGLNVTLLGRDDPVWMAYWELYVRAEIFMQTFPDQRPSKVFFDRSSTLPAY